MIFTLADASQQTESNSAIQPIHFLEARDRQLFLRSHLLKTNNTHYACISVDEQLRGLQVAGFVGIGFPEYLVNAVRKRFDSTAKPRNISIIAVAACGDGKGRGMDQLAVEGLTSAITFGWAGLSPALLKMISAKKISAYNLPLGVGERG